MQYRVISTDNHINEPPGTYVDRVPKHLREKAPRMLRGADGGDGWSFDGSPPKMTLGLGATGAITKQDDKEYRPNGITWDELPPGNYEGAAAIADNELDGVDAATIYPAAVGGAYSALRDRELAVERILARERDFAAREAQLDDRDRQLTQATEELVAWQRRLRQGEIRREISGDVERAEPANAE